MPLFSRGMFSFRRRKPAEEPPPPTPTALDAPCGDPDDITPIGPEPPHNTVENDEWHAAAQRRAHTIMRWHLSRVGSYFPGDPRPIDPGDRVLRKFLRAERERRQ